MDSAGVDEDNCIGGDDVGLRVQDYGVWACEWAEFWDEREDG